MTKRHLIFIAKSFLIKTGLNSFGRLCYSLF